MTKADRVYSTPPTNTSANNPKSSRRGFLVQAAGVAAGGAALGAGLPLPVAGFPTAAASAPDPIYAAIEKHKALAIASDAAWKARGPCKDFGALTEDEKQHIRKLNDDIDAAGLPMERAACELFDTVPTTPAGIVAAIRVIQSHSRDDNDKGHMPNGRWLYEDEDDSRNGRDWLECFLDTIAEAVDELGKAVQS